MENIILIAIILAIVLAALGYVYKAKKKGQHCIGCPYAGNCSNGKCNRSDSSDSKNS